MEQMIRIAKNLEELSKHGAFGLVYKSRKDWILEYKRNENAEKLVVFTKDNIEKFLLDELIKIDEKTGVEVY